MKLRTATTGLAITAAAIIPTAAACGPPPLTCIASASPTTPKQYTSVVIYVHSAPATGLTTTAYFRTTSTIKTGLTNSAGNGSTLYRISDATLGYRVNVTVSVVNGSQRASCATSFTPQA